MDPQESTQSPVEQDTRPAFEGRREAIEERELMLVRPAMFRAKPILFSFHILILLACIGAVVWVVFWTKQDWAAILIGIVFLIALGSLTYWRIKTWAVVLRITNERTVEDRGFFSRRTSEVMHHNIRNVEISQSLWDRIWGVGKLQIASAGHAGYEITFDDVVRPYEVKALIDRHRDYGEDD